MSKNAEAWVWDHSETNGNDRLVLLFLADQGDDDGTNSFPSVRRIADKCRVHTDTVKRTIERLESMGEVIVERPERQGRGYFNRYTLVLGRPISEVRALAEKGRDLRPFRQAKNARESAVRGAPGARLPIDPLTPSGITSDVEEERVTANASAREDSIARFDEHFWPAYPARNGKKLDKRKALDQWVKLSIDDQRAATKGARYYTAFVNADGRYPRDAHRWLRDRNWEEWQTPASAPPARQGRGQADAAQAIIDDIRDDMRNEAIK